MLSFLNLVIYLMTALGLARCAADQAAAQPLWTDVPKSTWKARGTITAALSHYRVLQLDTARLKRILEKQQGETDIRKAATVLTLPFPDGSFARFRFAASATMAPGPAGTRAASSTFFGQGADDPLLGLAFDLGPAGFHAMITSSREVVFIEPASRTGERYYLCYYKHDLKPGYRRPFEHQGPIRHPNNR